MESETIIAIIGYLGSLFFLLGVGQAKRINYLILFLIKDILQLIYYIGINDSLITFVTCFYIGVELFSIYSYYKPNTLENIVNKYSPWIVCLATVAYDSSYSGILIALSSVFFGFSLVAKEINSKYLLLASNSIWFGYGVYYQINPLILLSILVYINIFRAIYKIKKKSRNN